MFKHINAWHFWNVRANIAAVSMKQIRDTTSCEEMHVTINHPPSPPTFDQVLRKFISTHLYSLVERGTGMVEDKSRQPAKYAGFYARFRRLVSLLREPDRSKLGLNKNINLHSLSFLKTLKDFWIKVSLKTFWWGLSFWQILLRWQKSTNDMTFCPPYWISRATTVYL